MSLNKIKVNVMYLSLDLFCDHCHVCVIFLVSESTSNLLLQCLLWSLSPFCSVSPSYLDLPLLPARSDEGNQVQLLCFLFNPKKKKKKLNIRLLE